MPAVQIRLRGVKRFQANNKALGAYVRGKFAPEVVSAGLQYAKMIAPRDTGAMLKEIRGTKNKMSGSVYVQQPNHPISGSDRPYHLWMHGIKAPALGTGAGDGYDTSSGKYAPKTGDPKFMFSTADFMIKEDLERFKKKLRSIY